MLIMFYCDAYEDLVYFGEVALQLLDFMGQSSRVPGALLAVDLIAAKTKLQLALKNTAPQTNTKNDPANPIPLTHRALPLLNLLDAAIAANCDVLWRNIGTD